MRKEKHSHRKHSGVGRKLRIGRKIGTEMNSRRKVPTIHILLWARSHRRLSHSITGTDKICIIIGQRKETALFRFCFFLFYIYITVDEILQYRLFR